MLHRAGSGLSYPFDLLELDHRRPHDPLQTGVVLDDPVHERLGESGQAVQEPIATGLERCVGIGVRGAEPEHGR